MKKTGQTSPPIRWKIPAGEPVAAPPVPIQMQLGRLTGGADGAEATELRKTGQLSRARRR